jgi:hypothetical protein
MLNGERLSATGAAGCALIILLNELTMTIQRLYQSNPEALERVVEILYRVLVIESPIWLGHR